MAVNLKALEENRRATEKGSVFRRKKRKEITLKESCGKNEKPDEGGSGSVGGCWRIRDRMPEGHRAVKALRCNNKGQSILHPEKRKGLWMGFAAGFTAAALLGLGRPADRVFAWETEPETGGMAARDADMRKLLIRTGAVYEASGPVFIEIPRELIREGENLQIEVRAGKNGQGNRYRLAFTCKGKKPDSS